MKKYNFAIVGATGLVGQTFLALLKEYNLPVKELRLFASAKSVGKKIIFDNKEFYIQELNNNAFKDIDFALFSAGASVSRKWAPIARDSGAIVVDNSSCWRMDEECSLIVPEINLEDFYSKSHIIANPNCSTIQAVLPLKALEEKYHIERIVYTTYQAVSGSGQKGINDYEATLKGEEAKFYPYNISKTCIPHIDVFLDNGYTKEEMKMVNETKKILHRDDLKISATCVRVPVKVAHGVSVLVEFSNDYDIDVVRELFRTYPGLVLVDEPQKNLYPVSTMAIGNDKVYVGRIRRDLSSKKGLLFYCVADNIRKGAAANAVQIVEELIKRGEKSC